MASYDYGKDYVCAWIRENVPRDAEILDVGACDGKWRNLLPEYQNMDAVEIYEPNASCIEDLYRLVVNEDIYDFHYNPDGGAAGKWDVTCEWAEKEFDLPRKPGREAFYKWLRSMRELAPAHRREVRETADEIAAEGAKSLTVSDEEIISFVKSRALDAATVAKNPEEAERFLRMADSLIRAKFEAAEKRLERVAEIADAARGGKVDPAKVADEIDRILGRKK